MQDDATVSPADIARLAGVGRAAVSNWRRRHPDFPQPVGGTPASPVFALSEIEAWLRDQGKLRELPLEERTWQELRAEAGDDLRLSEVIADAGELLVRHGPTLRGGRDAAGHGPADTPYGQVDHRSASASAWHGTADARHGHASAWHAPADPQGGHAGAREGHAGPWGGQPGARDGHADGAGAAPPAAGAALPDIAGGAARLGAAAAGAVAELAAERGAAGAFEFLFGRYRDTQARRASATPPEVAHLMAELAGDAATVLDPACGTGDLLIAVLDRHFRQARDASQPSAPGSGSRAPWTGAGRPDAAAGSGERDAGTDVRGFPTSGGGAAPARQQAGGPWPPGSPGPGSPAPGFSAPGSAPSGSGPPGSPVPGSAAPGSAAPGLSPPGSAAQGSAAPGPAAPDPSAPGFSGWGSPEPGSPAPGSAVLGPAALGSAAPGGPPSAPAGPPRLLGQDAAVDAARLTGVRLALRGVRATVRAGDSLRRDALPGVAADAVVCDPPFHERAWGHEDLGTDPRWEYGLPPRLEPELAWVQHALAHLAPGGRALVLMPAVAAARRSGRRIRAELLRRGALRGVFALPSGHHLWLLSRPDGGVRNTVLMVDAADADAMDAIVATWRAHADDPGHDEPGVSRSVPVIDLLDEEVDLTPARHLSAAGAERAAERFADTQDRIAASVGWLGELMPLARPSAAPAEPPTVPIAELARIGYLAVHQAPPRRDPDDAEGGGTEPVLTTDDVIAGRPPSGRGHPDGARSVRVRPGDVVVAATGGNLVVRVAEAGDALLGPYLTLLRADPDHLDPHFLAGVLRSSANVRLVAAGPAGTTGRADVRRARVPRLPPAEQRRYGEAFRRMAAFESALRSTAVMGAELAQLLADGVTGGTLAPGSPGSPPAGG